jgi:hypothetical protein
MKRRDRETREKLHLAKETVRLLLSEELRQVAAGAGCPSLTGCSSDTHESLNECGSLFCSKIQY